MGIMCIFVCFIKIPCKFVVGCFYRNERKKKTNFLWQIPPCDACIWYIYDGCIYYCYCLYARTYISCGYIYKTWATFALSKRDRFLSFIALPWLLKAVYPLKMWTAFRNVEIKPNQIENSNDEVWECDGIAYVEIDYFVKAFIFSAVLVSCCSNVAFPFSSHSGIAMVNERNCFYLPNGYSHQEEWWMIFFMSFAFSSLTSSHYVQFLGINI